MVRLLRVVVVVLVDDALGLLVEGRDGRVAPPMVQVAVLVVLASLSHKQINYTLSNSNDNKV